jgi:hypothetical protein
LWLPQVFFLNERFLLQFSIVYGLILFIDAISLFYSLFYFIWFVVVSILFLSLIQTEIFGAFLFLTEAVIVFVILMLIISLTAYDLRVDVTSQLKNLYLVLLFVFFSSYNMLLPSELEFYLPELFIDQFLWDDWYEALNNDKTNDLYAVYLSFYLVNSLEFVCVIYLLLVGSLICVNMNKVLKSNKSFNYKNMFDLFDIFKDSIMMLFLRNQNLVDQATTKASSRFFKKK